MEHEQSNTFKVKPAPGARVRDPRTREPLPPEGRDVERSTFWRSRIADGSVVLVETSPIERIVEDPPTERLDGQHNLGGVRAVSESGTHGGPQSRRGKSPRFKE